MLFDPPQAFGLILDISQRKASDGKQLSKKIRTQLVDFVGVLQGDDALYLCQQNPKRPAIEDGERTALVGNWEAPEETMDLGYALEYTLASLAQEDPDGDRTLCLVTDRLREDQYPVLNNLNTLRQKAGLECRFVVIGVEKRYNVGGLAAFCVGENIEFRHVADPDRLAEVMKAWFDKEQHG